MPTSRQRESALTENGGKLEIAQQMANHESARATGLYDRRNDQISLDEVERIPAINTLVYIPSFFCGIGNASI